MSTPSMLAVPKWEASARVIMPSLQPMSRQFLFWNQGFSIICINEQAQRQLKYMQCQTAVVGGNALLCCKHTFRRGSASKSATLRVP